MTIDITINAKPFEKKVEVPGYGIFTVKRLGAGVQADLADNLREIQNLQEEANEEYEDIISKEKALIEEKNDAALSSFKQSDSYKKAMSAQKKVSDLLQRLNNKVARLELGLWKSDDKDALNRFLSDFTLDEIRGFYQQVMNASEEA